MAAALKAAGHDVWWDQALKSGEVYDQVTEAALREAKVVVVLWSKTSVVSDWVRSEATVAMQRGALMPAMIEDCQRPVMFELRQSADLLGWKGNAKDPRLLAFVAEVTRQLARPVAAKAGPVPATASMKGPNRRVLIGGAAGVAALAAGGFAGWRAFGGQADDGTASVAVLPFANLSGDPGQAFFSDGIAEELRNALSQIRGLKVIGGVSSEKFRNADDLPAVAEKLGVDHILTGSVRRSLTTIRIGAQLVDGRTGVESWSHSYDQPIGDALAIQSKIATSVVGALSTRLAKAAGLVVVGGSRNPRAQELLLKAGKAFSSADSKAGFLATLALLDAAIAIDPDCAVAWAGAAFAKSNLVAFATSAADQAVLKDEAMAASQRAVAIAPESGFARQSLAFQYLTAVDLRRALAEGERAIALAPADVGVIFGFTQLLQLFDPDRAVSIIREAASLDPFNPYYYFTYGKTLYAARRYREAAEASRHASALSNNQLGIFFLIRALLCMDDIESARANLGNIQQEQMRLSYKAIIEARAGNRAASDAALLQLRKRGDDSINTYMATVHAQRGETAAALDALETALRSKEVGITFIAIDPLFDPISRESRFKAVRDAVVPPDLFVPPKRR